MGMGASGPEPAPVGTSGESGNAGFPTWIGTAGLAWIAVALGAILPYLNALRAGFVFDDQILVVEQLSKLGPFRPFATLARPYWTALSDGNLWRPITTLSLELDWRLSGGSPVWFHLVNLILHTAVTLLLFGLLLRLLRGLPGGPLGRPSGRLRLEKAVALAAALLFAVHPVHTEAVTWVAGRAELLAALFTLAALHLALRAAVRSSHLAQAGAVAACLLAVGSKESGATAPFLILLTGAIFRPQPAPGDPGAPAGTTHRPDTSTAAPSWLTTGLWSLGPVLLFALLRRAVLQTWSGPVPDPLDNPMAGLGLIARLPSVLDAAGRYLFLLLWPARLSLDYSGSVIGTIRKITPGVVAGAIAAGGLVALAAAALRRPARMGTPAGFEIRPEVRTVAGWGAGLAILGFLPASNLFVVIGTNLAERLLYLPSIGFFVIAAVYGARAFGFARSSSRITLLGTALLAVILLAGGARTWIRNRDYRDEITVFRAGTAAAPGSAKMHLNLALRLNQARQYEESVREARIANAIEPGNRQSRHVLASSMELSGDKEGAVEFLLNEVGKDPADRKSRLQLVELLALAGRPARMESVLVAAVTEDPATPEWFVRLARSAQERGDYARAAGLWRQALAMVPDAEDAPLYLAFCLLQTRDYAGARDIYEQMLRRFPNLPDAANGLAWTLLQTGGSPQEAARWARQAVAAKPLAPYYDTLARALLASGDCPAALDAAETAARLDPADGGIRSLVAEVRARCSPGSQARRRQF